jgi:hypothetical protein
MSGMEHGDPVDAYTLHLQVSIFTYKHRVSSSNSSKDIVPAHQMSFVNQKLTLFRMVNSFVSRFAVLHANIWIFPEEIATLLF